VTYSSIITAVSFITVFMNLMVRQEIHSFEFQNLMVCLGCLLLEFITAWWFMPFSSCNLRSIIRLRY